jgi:hypothetical protein
MDETLNSRPLGLVSEAFRCFYMYGMKCLSSAFDVEADGVHHAAGSADGRRKRAFVVDIGTH